MDSNSLQTHLSADALQPGDYVRLLQMLLQAMSRNAIVTDSEKVEAFRDRVDGVAKNLTEFADSRTFTPGIESVIQALQAHHRHANQLLQAAKRTASLADSTTGLPSRAIAEQTIAERVGNPPGEFVVALFIVDRVPTINARFGRAMGDKVLLTVANHLTQKVSPFGPLMRWSGPGFVTILEMTSNWHQLERDIKRIASFRQQFEMTSGGRSTMLPLTCTVCLHKAAADATPETLFQELDGLLASNNGTAAP